MTHGISLAACGLSNERIEADPGKLLILGQPVPKTAARPMCGGQSGHVHSRYQRSLADLPSQGCTVAIRLYTRRFRCTRTERPQKIFTEQLAATADRPYVRRTARLDDIVHHLGLALGRRPGQSLAKRLLKEPWSNGQTERQNTKLKLIKRQMYGQAKLDLLRARLPGAS